MEPLPHLPPEALPKAATIRAKIEADGADRAPDEQQIPFLTVVALVVPHALILAALEGMTRKSTWRATHNGEVICIMLLVALLIVPGAVVGWFVRGHSFSIKRWLTFAGAEWLGTALLAMAAYASNVSNYISESANHYELVLLAIPMAATLILGIVLAFTTPRRHEPKTYPHTGRKRRINVPSISDVPVGNAGPNSIDIERKRSR
jgi:hypothetical protein